MSAQFVSEVEAHRFWFREIALGATALFDEIIYGKKRPDLIDFLDANGFPRRDIHRWEDDGGSAR